MRHQGKITTWKDDQGYGFITPNLGGDEVFVHINSFVSQGQRPALEQIVTYELGADERGRARAGRVDVVRSRKNAARRQSTGPSRLPLFLAAGFMAFVALAVWRQQLPAGLLAAYLVLSLATFIAYASDKAAAQSRRWRTRERTLHLLALAGGWPGALIAQNRLRHKSNKSAFLFVFWASVLLNGASLAWLLTPGGQAWRAALGIG